MPKMSKMEPDDPPGDDDSNIDQEVNQILREQDVTATPDGIPLNHPTHLPTVIESLGETVLESSEIDDNRESIHDFSSSFRNTSSDMHNTVGVSRESRSNPPPQSHESSLSPSSSHNDSTSFLSNNSSGSGYRLQQPTRDISGRSSDRESSIENAIYRVENSFITLADRFASLEQKVGNALAANSDNRKTQNKLDAIAVDSQNANLCLTAITDILERSTGFEDTIVANFRGISDAVLKYNNNLNEAMKACQEINIRMAHYAAGLVSFDKSLNDFRYAWDVNRNLVNSYQEMILSLVSWLESPALFFRILSRMFRPLVFWHGARDGENQIKIFANGGYGGPARGGGEEFNDHEYENTQNESGVQDNGQGSHGEAVEQGVPPEGQISAGQQPGGIQDIEQEVDGNVAAAQPAPGQIDSPFRADGLPWDTYNPGVNDTPTARNGLHHLKSMMITCWKYFLLLVFFICVAKLILAPLLFFQPIFNNTPKNRRDAASTGRAHLSMPVLLALIEAQNDTLAVAELALQSAESVAACAKLDLDGGGGKPGLFERWYVKVTMDREDRCVEASSLATQAASRIQGLSSKLEWVFGEKWWVTVSSTRGNAENTATNGLQTKTALTETSTVK